MLKRLTTILFNELISIYNSVSVSTNKVIWSVIVQTRTKLLIYKTQSKQKQCYCAIVGECKLSRELSNKEVFFSWSENMNDQMIIFCAFLICIHVLQTCKIAFENMELSYHYLKVGS